MTVGECCKSADAVPGSIDSGAVQEVLKEYADGVATEVGVLVGTGDSIVGTYPHRVIPEDMHRKGKKGSLDEQSADVFLGTTQGVISEEVDGVKELVQRGFFGNDVVS